MATAITMSMPRRSRSRGGPCPASPPQLPVSEAPQQKDKEAREAFHRDSPVAPTVRHIQWSTEFIELVGVFHVLVTAAGGSSCG